MATISKSWGGDTNIEGTSGSPTTLSGTTEEFSSDVDLETNGYEGAVVFVDINFDATPTDNVEVRVYGSEDGTNYDDTPIYMYVVDNGTDPNQTSFIVRDYLHFRVSFKQTGSTDSHDVWCHYNAWRWSSA